MENSYLQSYFSDQDNTESVEVKLTKLLSIIRKHLSMNVAFISQFIEGDRVFKFVDVDSESCPIRVGGSDPLEETYCKKIVDNQLDNIIHDTSKNDITKNLDVTAALSIGSYMGVPIRLSNGEVYGTFCCYKYSSDRLLNERDLSFLKAISEITSDLIESNIVFENSCRDCINQIQSVLNEDKLTIYYQPIYDVQIDRLVGFESLSRFMTEPYQSPDIWFKEAKQVGLGKTLEMTAIKQAIKPLDELDKNVYLTVNTSPEYVLNGAVAKVLNHVDAKRIVIEITEHSPIDSYTDLKQALAPLRERGMRLAIDDAGAGYSSFQQILELQADIIKLDMSLTQNIHLEPRKYLLAKALCDFAKSVNCIIVAEGIECEEELLSIKSLGVDKVQGYLLGRPMPLGQVLEQWHLLTKQG